MVFNRSLRLIYYLNYTRNKPRSFIQSKLLISQKRCFSFDSKSGFGDNEDKEAPKELETNKKEERVKELLTKTSQDSSSSSDDSSSSSDSDSEKEPDTKSKALEKKERAIEKLNALLSSMSVSETYQSSKAPLELARPFKTVERKRETKEKIKKLKEIEALGVDAKIADAVKVVAQDLGGDVQQTESEILKKLREHAVQTEANKNGKVNLDKVFLGMKIDRSKPKPRVGYPISSEIIPDEDDRKIKHFSEMHKERRSKLQTLPVGGNKKINLFGSGSLNIFRKSEVSSQDKKEMPQLKIWDALEEKELKELITPPPSNAFEEMIVWTEQGKLWKFPIDNFQGCEEEAKYGFHEHVFLEHLLEDGFPKKGPIRHFMELVVTGLSKNPYLTVPEKHDHINWFRQYFKEKEEILKKVDAL